MGQATIKLVRRRPRAAALLGAAVAMGVLAFLLYSSSVGRATSSDSAYTVPGIIDLNPAPNIVETSLNSIETTVNVGTPANPLMANAQTFGGSIPGPTFRLKVGDTVSVHYKNELAHPSAIHWHGIELSNTMDGTPLTQNTVAPGKEFLYKFKATRPGIYWYHPHHHASTNQVFKGLYGMILVEDPNDAALQASGTLPPAAQTKPIVLSDLTVCKAPASSSTPSSNDTQTYLPGVSPPALPWVNGPSLPLQQEPTPIHLCETILPVGPGAGDPIGPIDEDGNPRAPFAAGDIPNNQTLATRGPTNEGQTVLTNGMNVGGRAGTPAAPGTLAAGAQVLTVQAGQGLRLPILNAATTRFMRLRLTTAAGAIVPLVRVGGEGGLLDAAVVEGGTLPGGFVTKYGAGEILLPPGSRADVVAAIPPAASGVLTMWTEDFSRTGGGFANIPTVPVMHLQVSGSVPTYTIGAGTPLRSATGDPVPTLGAPTGTLLNPGTFTPTKLGLPNQNIQLTASATVALGVDGIAAGHESDPYTTVPHLGSSRYAKVGDTLQLSVTNVTGAHHPFHLHGFSMQPISLTPTASAPPGSLGFTWPYREFRDNIDVPAQYTLTYRIKIEDRPLPDGTTLGGALGRWVFHCHIFFHHTNGMLSELVVAAPNGNEAPDVNADLTRVGVLAGQTATMTGTFSDRDGDPVTLSASLGSVTAGPGGTWSWSRPAAVPADSGFVYVTATDSGGRKDQAVFSLAVASDPPPPPPPPPTGPALALTPDTATNPVLTSHTVTAKLANVTPLDAQKILFSVTGAHTKSATATTSATGTASFTYAGVFVGDDQIAACHDANANATCDPVELNDAAKKTWILPDLGLDHFKCYAVTPARTRSRAVRLTDQFGSAGVRTGARTTLCNPVSKNKGKIIHPTAHLTCYATRGAATFRTRRVRVVNQFGTRVLTVLRPSSLCLPSLKRIGTDAPKGKPPSTSLDHFRCYDVKAQRLTRTVRTKDQFGTRTTRVVASVSLCNPVRKTKGKTISRIRRRSAHLVCYTIRDGRGNVKRAVVLNQFETARLRAGNATTLCLPSVKQDL
jgi:FtsP/CotA-like multicopper oxidase with cupredoxin domain